MDPPSFFLLANKPSDGRKASVSTSLLGTFTHFCPRSVVWNLSGRPLKLILGDEASQDLAKFQYNVLSHKEEKEHSFWDGAHLWMFGPGPTKVEQNSMENCLFTLPNGFFFLPAQPSSSTFGSSQLPTCLSPLVLTNWIIIVYLLGWAAPRAWETNCYHCQPHISPSQRPSPNEEPCFFTRTLPTRRASSSCWLPRSVLLSVQVTPTPWYTFLF